jgi:arsenite-transporting ATPase
VAKLTLFIGKGGVGKTTVSAAYALRQANLMKKPVLLLSTDPAHSLSDLFQQRFTDTPKAVAYARSTRLFVAEISASSRFRNFVFPRQQELVSLLERGSMFSKEEIAPFLDVSMPGMVEISALIAIRDALSSGTYSAVVVDTAPFGHTLRLFELPKYFEGFLRFLERAAGREAVLARHFGGDGRVQSPQLLEDWKEALRSIQSALRNTGELFLVATSERFALNESFRCAARLRKSSLQVAGVVLNRVVLHTSACRTCSERAKSGRQAKKALRRHFPAARFYVAEDLGSPVLGPDKLHRFAAHVFAKARARWTSQPPKSAKVKLIRVVWPELRSKLTLVTGKGGVGKTTISAALGVHSREVATAPVDICSVDPAPSLDDVFQSAVTDQFRAVLGDAKFRAAELDSAAEFQAWAQKVKSRMAAALDTHSGVHIDLSFERGLFEQLLDCVPPGVDEVLSVFRIQKMLSTGSGKLLIDMAPTGHALELLRTPERLLAWTHLLLKTLAAQPKLVFVQDAAVELAELGQHTRALVQGLKSRNRTKIFVVMLAESLPDRETARLIDDLALLGLAVDAIFVNRVIFPKDAGGCSRCMTASRWQRVTLSKLEKKYPEMPILVARNLPHEISGRKNLRDFTRELWRLQ